MDALYYLCSLIGVVWLVVWAIRQEGNLKQIRSPFDLRETGKPVKDKRYQPRKPG